MTQPNPAVGGDPVPTAQEPADATEAFEAIASEWLGDDEPEEAAEPVEGEQPEAEEASEESEDDLEIEAEDEELPPIDAPVSWDAEAKEKFASLPRDVQEYVAKREGEREKFVQAKSQEAARARQEVEQTALQQVAAYEEQVAAQLQQYAQQLQPQRPDPRLLEHNPQAFYAQQAEYEAGVAQQRELQQQAQQYAQQAQQRQAEIAQAEHAQQVQILTEKLPEYLDPTTGPKLREEYTAVAKELGYPDELIAQARASDILAMKTAADWKAKAAKYDALQAKKMEKVRAAKGLPKVATPGVAAAPDAARAARANAAWEATKNSQGNARNDAFADYLKTQGLI